MNLTSTENNNLHLCNTCGKSYGKLRFLTMHQRKLHGIIKENPKINGLQQKKKRKRKVAHKKHCIICCKYYSTVGGFKNHMKTYHGGDENLGTNHLLGQQPFLWKKGSRTTNVSTDDVFVQFENEMPQELRDDDALRCRICNSIFPNNDQFIEHEKVHFEINSSSDSDEEISFMRLEITNNGTDCNPINSFEIVCEMTCDTCLSKFKSVSKHEQHEKLCAINMAKDFEVLRIGCTSTIANVNKMKEVGLSQNLIIFPKESRSRSKHHMKALLEFTINQRKIDCEICGKGCENLDHLEYHQWWNSS